MTAVTGLGVLLGILVFAYLLSEGCVRRIHLGVVLLLALGAGGAVTYAVVAAGALVLGELSWMR